jgi:hypothetical protein
MHRNRMAHFRATGDKPAERERKTCVAHAGPSPEGALSGLQHRASLRLQIALDLAESGANLRPNDNMAGARVCPRHGPASFGVEQGADILS